jgi:hypothetical protein
MRGIDAPSSVPPLSQKISAGRLVAPISGDFAHTTAEHGKPGDIGE